jgi:PQQ-like domain
VARPTPVRTTLLFTLLAATVGLPLCLTLVGVLVSGTGSADRQPRSTPPPSPPPQASTTTWALEPGQLRPDLPGAAFIPSLDGDFATGYVAEVAGVWLTLTGTDEAEHTELHAVVPQTGVVRWQRELDGALCGSEGPKTAILCASVLQRDPATGLGTRWRLHVLDPATGQDRATRDIEGWLTAVHWTGRAFVVLEQRQPAPHAVLRGFAATDLHPLWTRDLAHEPGQEEMFSEDRIIGRPEPERSGLALDRPRLRDVGHGLVAVWAGQRTAFVDPADGRLVMMPHCSRLVDDGSRLWCNEVDGVSGYSYAGRPTVRVRGPRLAFPGDDGVGVDRNRPVFLDEDGAGVAVDPKTGAVGAAYTPPGRGSAFGETTMPSAETVGDRTFLIGEAGVMLLEPKKDGVVWRNPAITYSDAPIVLGDKVLLPSGRGSPLVDLATGATVSEASLEALFTVAVGDRIVGEGSEGISLLRF